jgi:uncharacterized protein YjbI with pentapeptide repeats
MGLLNEECGFLGEGPHPPMPSQRPQYDDDGPLGISFMRCGFEKPMDFSDLTLRRTFFNKSKLERVSFRNTDLSESTLCWNDFVNTDFEHADLNNADLRASIFEGCSFVRANLAGADLRGSSFERCDFSDANFESATLTLKDADALDLSDSQRKRVAWSDDIGDDPSGG